MEEQRSFAHGVTVDGPTSRDLDDAIDVEKTADGWNIHVSIADVCASVLKGTPIDQQAFDRAFTRYLAQGNRPMLPRNLADNDLSLLPDRKRKTITFSIVLDPMLTVRKMEISRTWLKSRKRFSHAEVDEILDTTGHDQHEWWRDCFDLSQRLLNKRRNEGALVVFDLKKGLLTNEDGEVKRMPSGKYFRAYLIVQELMILTNEAVTTYLHALNVPLLFRNHTTRQEDVRQHYLEALNALLITPTAEQLDALGSECRHIMNRARYGPVLEGHFALNLAAYAHWTSPIRRYADVVNHRMLAAWLDQQPMPYTEDALAAIGDHLNEVSDQIRDKKDDLFRGKRINQYLKAGKAALLSLPSGDFRSFIKRIIDETIPLNVDRSEAIAQRIEGGSVGIVDIARVLFVDAQQNPCWNPIKQAALQWLQNNPADVFGVIQLAHEVYGTPELGELPFVRTTSQKQHLHHVSVSMMFRDRTYASKTCASTTRKEADQAALLDLVVNIVDIPTSIAPRRKDTDTTQTSNPKGLLLARCQQLSIAAPSFETTDSGPLHRRTFACTATLVFLHKEYVSGPCTAHSKKAAEREASVVLLAQLPQKFLASDVQAPTLNVLSNPIGALQELVQQRGLELPRYTYEQSGSANAPIFACTCTLSIGGAEKEWKGVGRNKPTAKADAAKTACKELLQRS